MNRKDFLVGAIALSLLSMAGAGATSAAGQQGINPECSNRFAVCPPRFKAKEKPDWTRVKGVRASTGIKARKLRSKKHRRQ